MGDDIILDKDEIGTDNNINVDNQAADTSSGQAQVFDADAYQTLLETIRHKNAKLEVLTGELSQKREELDSVLINDETYQKHVEEVRAATKIRNKTKNELLKLVANQILVEKIKEITASIKDLKAGLSEDLVQYVNTAGVNEFEDENGIPREIVFSARLKAKARREDN